MDEITIMILTSKLLEVCDMHKGNSIFSVIAELDRKPANSHRLFSNVLTNQPLIVEVASDILQNDEVKSRNFHGLRRKYEPKIKKLKEKYSKQRNSDPRGARVTKNELYCCTRILEDLEYFFDRLREAEQFVGKEISEIRTDVPAAHLALSSQTYLISYTFPPQPFFPHASNASQHVDFFKKIDYFDFKLMFSGEERSKINEFRKSMLKNEMAWSRRVDSGLEINPIIKKRIEEAFDKPFDPYGMIKAIIERLGELAPGAGYEAVQRTIREYFAKIGCKKLIHSDRERWFLVNLEKEIEKTIIDML